VSAWLLVGVLVIACAAFAPIDLRWRGLLGGLWSAAILVAFDLAWTDADRLLTWELAWLPQLEIAIALRADGLSALFVNLIAGIGAVVMPYTGVYLQGKPRGGQVLALLLGFQAAMLGVALADDLIALFLAWEATSVISFGLIASDYEQAKARRSARHAMLITGLGGLALLGGILIAADAIGSFRASDLIAAAELGQQLPRSAWFLIVVGCLSKSALVPFHAWLPLAMAAPTPVSAYLHSATMVKAGVFLLLRLDPILSLDPLWTPSLVSIGVVTLVYAGFRALRVADLKQVLAWTTIAALGTVTTAIGLGSPAGLKAALVFIVVHALYKSSLFMLAGAVDKFTGTRDLRMLAGLRHTLPLGAITGAMAGLSMAGVPPLVGFMGKELLYKAKLGSGDWLGSVALVAVLGNALAFCAAMMVGLEPFRTRGREVLRPERSVKVKILATLAFIPALGSLVLGVAPELLADQVLERSVHDVIGHDFEVKLSLWYGFDTALALSAVTVVLGLVVWQWRIRSEAGWLRERTITDLWMFAFDQLPRSAKQVCDPIARLGTTGLIAAGAVIVAGLGAHAAGTGSDTTWVAASVDGGLDVVCLVGAVAAALAAGTVKQRLTSIAAMGLSGSLLALWFLHRGAPDVGATQLLVEAASLLVLAWAWLQSTGRASGPVEGPIDPKPSTLWRLTVAVGCGGLLTYALLAAGPWQPDRTLVDRMIGDAYPLAHGRNVVNVTLVDYRMFDTLGETLAVAMTAIVVWWVLARPGGRLGAGASGVGAGASKAIDLLGISARMLGWLLVIVALPVFYRGHDEPGGGFLGGLVAGMGLVLIGIASRGDPRREARFGAGVGWAIVVGAVLAAFATIPALWAGRPLATNLWTTLPMPWGPWKVGTPLLFDAGVLAIVAGFCGKTYVALSEASEGRRFDLGLAAKPSASPSADQDEEEPR
jgi:multicomponent Na+:H+ antiporter subunit A